MCGIFGWVKAGGVAHREAVLRRALDAQFHRGPDGSGTLFSHLNCGSEVALGHRRLAIIDPSGGAQPFVSHDQDLTVSYNGEIYNYVELREELKALGHRFRTDSDTEVLIEAYRAWGADCLPKFRGMFAFALHDRRRNKVILARDPFGKKPLFVADIPGGFAFSSDIAALSDFTHLESQIDDSVLPEYLSARYVEGPRTFFRGITKLLPGTYATWEGDRLHTERYFTPPIAYTETERLEPRDALRAFSSTLDEAVRIRMRSDAKFGAFISGGLDSSVIAALMARHSPHPISTFAVGFEDPAHSELPYARIIAAQLNTRHSELIITPMMFLNAWPLAVRLRGAPVSEPSDIPIYLLSKEASSDVKMVLTGEGADEFLAGYPKYRAERYVDLYHTFISPDLHRRLIDPMIRSMPYRARRLKILSMALGVDSAEGRQRIWFANATDGDVSALAGGDLTIEAAPTAVGGAHKLSSVRQLQIRDQMSWLPDNLLERGDRMMMGGSIEGRMPFMDTELARLTARFRDGLLLGHPRGKAILRAMASGLLDDRIIQRPKIGFAVPIGDWFRAEFRELVTDLLASRNSNVAERLDGRVIARILDEHMAHRQNHERIIWTLCNLELFYREFSKAGRFSATTS